MGRDAKKLELHKVLVRLSKLCNNPVSRQMVEELLPLMDKDILEERYAENQEALQVLRLAVPTATLRFSDVRPSIQHAMQGGILDVDDLILLMQFLMVSEEYVQAKKHLTIYPRLHEWAEHTQSFSSLWEKLNQSVDSDGKILDRASKKLYALRRAQVSLMVKIKNKMDDLIHSDAGRKLLQEQLVTIRNGRYVVPLKAEYKGKMQGIVHDQSSTGSTLFLEPSFAVELNNELKQNQLDEEEEIRRILREISQHISIQGELILQQISILGAVDFIFARARLSMEMEASSPNLNINGIIFLKQARHPLIQGHVVANDIILNEGFSCVIITGPNTGGKTIALKTLGLLVLMAKLGLDVPCENGSEVALFDQIFADIGDEQSIEQSLSTYSSHMMNIIRITQMVTSNSLVLLDELGAGTDPTEGAALASSLLEFFCQRGIRTMATTHFGELKAFAYKHPGVVNASVEFNTETLRPTYRLLMGTPGLSNALLIAKQLGLSSSIVERAQSYISHDELEISRMIADLEDKRKQAEEMQCETKRLSEEVTHLRMELESQEKRAEQKYRLMMEEAYEEAESIIQQARKGAEALIQELKIGLEKNDRNGQLQIANEIRMALRQDSNQWKEMKKASKSNASVEENTLKLGDRVRVLSLNQKGNVLSLPNAKGEMLVQIGIMKTNVTCDDVQKIQDEQTQHQGNLHTRIQKEKVKQISMEIDLRGHTSDEAYEELEKFIDDALLAGLPKIRIIHGKGTGALSRFTREYLRDHRQIASFHQAEPQEGGSGVTIAMFGQ